MADDERDRLLVAAMKAFAPHCRFRTSSLMENRFGHDVPEPATEAEKAAQCTYKGVSLGDFTDDGLRALIASLSNPGDKDAHLACHEAYYEAIRNVHRASFPAASI